MNEMPKLTDRQQQILDLVQSAIERTGAPPTRAEIANELGFKSANAAEEHLQALARKGVIELVGGTSRGIRLQSDTLRALNQARGKQYSPAAAEPGAAVAAAGRPRRRGQPDPGAGAHRPDLPDGGEPVPAPARLPAQGARHEHADAGIMDGDLLAVQKAQGGEERPDRRRPPRRRRHRQALPAQRAARSSCCPRTPTSRPSSSARATASRSKAWPSA